MSNVGIAHPSILDLVTQTDKEIRLVLVEERALLDEDATALQEKLNNYLCYAIDGALLKHYPESQGKQVCIGIDLYAPPAPFIIEFLHQYREAVAQYQVNVRLNICGESFSEPTDA